MKTEKWVPCTEELAENPERVKAWRNKNEDFLRLIAYDKEHERYPIVVRSISGSLHGYAISSVECLIEISIQERFVTFYDGDKLSGNSWPSLESANDNKAYECTHILKLAYDGQNFQVEPVWIKEST